MGSSDFLCEALRVRRGLDEDVSFFLFVASSKSKKSNDNDYNKENTYFLSDV